MKDKNVEESIQKEDDIWLDRHAVQKHWLWCSIESIRHKSGLNHDQGIVNVFLVENTAVGTTVSSVNNSTQCRLTDRKQFRPDYY